MAKMADLAKQNRERVERGYFGENGIFCVNGKYGEHLQVSTNDSNDMQRSPLKVANTARIRQSLLTTSQIRW